MYSGKERIAHFRHDQQSLLEEYLIDQHQCADQPDPFDQRQIRIVHGGERLAQSRIDGDPIGPVATNDSYDPDDSRVGLPVSGEHLSLEKFVRPGRSRAKYSPPSKSSSASVPPAVSARGRDVDVFSWRLFAAGAAVGSLAAAAALVVISVAV